ncbi:MAG: hypothetical protein HOA90_03850 [Prolixibacteraceae bacterium]|nr:hypothetical protein [Prolixibacteraceae bacterium]
MNRQSKQPYKKSQAVKQLEKMANIAARAKNPNIPPEWLAPRKYRDDSANNLTKCIIHFIRLIGGQAERIANMGSLIDTRVTFNDVTDRTRTIGSKKWIKGTGTNGTADVSATIKGRSVKVEVKHGKDRQSEVQCLYQRNIELAGGLYVIATTFEQVYNWYNLKFE